jgi:hypothetical protein
MGASMSKYLLTCGCGATLPVDVGQAGERVACQCGATLEVPPLRKLRHLPLAPSAASKSTAIWNLRKGLIAACLTIAVILAAVALGSWLTDPTVPSFTAGRDQSVDEALKTITPVQAWTLWISAYRPLAERGFSDIVHSHAAAVDCFQLQGYLSSSPHWSHSGRGVRQGDKEAGSQGEPVNWACFLVSPLSLSPCLIISPRTGSSRFSS